MHRGDEMDDLFPVRADALQVDARTADRLHARGDDNTRGWKGWRSLSAFRRGHRSKLRNLASAIAKSVWPWVRIPARCDRSTASHCKGAAQGQQSRKIQKARSRSGLSRASSQTRLRNIRA
jgi:hypothetical protein